MDSSSGISSISMASLSNYSSMNSSSASAMTGASQLSAGSSVQPSHESSSMVKESSSLFASLL